MFKQSAGITKQQIGDETILVDSQGNAVHVLNASALVIWQCCDGQHSAEQIVDKLREAFAVSAEYDLTQDVAKTLVLFHEKGLVQ